MTAPRAARTVAQAKLNLFLRILAREASGYHQLETLFQRVDLGDDVTVRVGVRGRSVDTRGADVGPLERNLAWRAAVAYAEAAGWPDGFAVEIDKRVPVGGGLGGGSADAGAVLRCLDRLAPRPLGPAALLGLASGLGADVPFLTAEHPRALAWGRGERMLALPPLPPRRATLALFERGVATAEAFGALAAQGGPDAPRPIVWSAERLATWDDVALVATNDLERAVLPGRDDVAEIRRLFVTVARELETIPGSGASPGDRAPFGLMTGSGATVYLLTPLAGPAPVFDVVHTVDPAAPAPPNAGFAIVETTTATRVAAVELSG